MVSLSKKTDYEKLKKEIIDEHNLIRSNPTNFIKILEGQKQYFKGKIFQKPGEVGIQTQEGWDAYQDAIEVLKKMETVEPLKLSEGLCKAAQEHADDIGPKGLIDHTGTDKSKCTERIERYCQWTISAAENIDFGSSKADDVLASLFCDDGVSNRGHRKNIINPAFKHIGVGVQDHKEYGVCVVIIYVGKILSESPSTSTGDGQKVTSKVADKLGGLANKMKDVEIVESEDPFADDPDAPKDAISCDISVETKTCGKKVTKTTVKTYKTSKGETVVKTLVEESG